MGQFGAKLRVVVERVVSVALSVWSTVRDLLRDPKIQKWALFSLVAGLLPVFLDEVTRLAGKEPGLDFNYLFPASNTYLIGVGIAMNGFGELLYEKGIADEHRALTFFSTVTVAVGCMLYAFFKSDITARSAPALVFLFLATGISFACVFACRGRR